MSENQAEKIKRLVVQGLNEVKEANDGKFEVNDSLVVLGDGGALDSFEFVSFVADLEEKVADEFGKEISLVSEKAFSKKHSPFKTIERICQYVAELLDEA